MSTAWWWETVWKNTYTHTSMYRHVHVPIKNPQNINQTKPEKSQPTLPPRIIKSKPWISKALRAFSPWIIHDYSWIILKSQVHFYVFYVTRWFPFINFWSCYRLQMPGMSPFLTASIMEIMLQAGNVRSSSLPALTPIFTIAFFLLPTCIPSARKGNNGRLLSVAHHGKKIKFSHILWKKHYVFSLVGSVRTEQFSGHTTGRAEWNSSSLSYLLYG